MSGKIFVVDGPDGCGKSSAAAYMKTLLEKKYNTVVSIIPAIGGGFVGAKYRERISDMTKPKPDVLFEILMSAGNNIETLLEEVLPRVKNGEIVILDRSISSFYAYQVIGRQSNFAKNIFYELIDSVRGADYYLYFKIDQINAEQRVFNRGAEMYLDIESDAFKSRVIWGYDQFYENLAYMFKHKRIINANKSIEEVQAQIHAFVETL